jgi:hypothetical protein
MNNLFLFAAHNTVVALEFALFVPPATADFPHTVRFEQGAAQFSSGDSITILEVRGTADTFAPIKVSAATTLERALLS